MECPLGIMVNILEPFTYGINLFRKELPYLEEFASIACQVKSSIEYIYIYIYRNCLHIYST